MGGYLDLAIGLNFLVDLLLLAGTNRLCGFPAGWGRCALGAALGGIYGGACLIPGWLFLGNFLWCCVSLGLMCLLAFGAGGWKRWCVFLLLSLALGGAGAALETGAGAIALCAGGIWGICRLTGSGLGKRYLPLEVHFQDRQIRVTALLDTGNQLKDPLTGESVLILDPESAGILTGLTRAQLARPLTAMNPGFRLIPYRALGVEGGMLLAKRFEDVRLGRFRGARVIAFSPEPLGSGRDYQALAEGGCI